MLYTARLKLYIKTGRSQKFRTQVLKARDNADDSFTFGNVVFHMGESGSVFTELDIHDTLPAIIGRSGLQIKRCTISADYPAAKISVQSGSYGGRRDYANVHASVTKDGDTVKIEAAGAPHNKLIRFFDQIVAGDIVPNT